MAEVQVDPGAKVGRGSVGLPFNGFAKSSYAIVDIKVGSFQTSIVRVNYDLNKVYETV